MSRQTLRQHLTEYYGNQPLSGATADRLRSLADVDRDSGAREVVYRYPGRWLQITVGLAACIALVLSAASFYAVRGRTHVDQFVGRDPIGQRVPAVNRSFVSGVLSPRYVTVKFQIDGCPLAAGIEPTFVKLLEKYCERPVLFARYDMTDAKRQRLSQNQAVGLGIDWAYEGAFQSGTILLIDRKQGKILATCTNREQLPEMVSALDRALN